MSRAVDESAEGNGDEGNGGEGNGGGLTLPPLGLKDIARALVGLVLVVLLIAYGLPYFLDTSWAEIWTQLSRVRAPHAVAMAALLVGALVSYTWVLTGSLPGLGHRQGFKANAVSSLVANVLPLGAAIGFALQFMMYRSWGFLKREISSSLLVTGLWNLLARIALPVIGCLVLVAGPIDAPRIIINGALLAGVAGTGVLVVAALMVFSDTVSAQIVKLVHTAAGWFGRGARPRGLDQIITDQRHRIASVVRHGGLEMTLGMAGQFVLLFGLYWLAARSVGLDLPLAELIAAYTFRQMLTAVAVTPGGLGVTEVGTAGLLVILGGSAGAASATALLYAIYAHLVVVPFGVVALVAWRVEGRRAAVP
ncbi:lysylphosphatidylglycerol synthase transmembrane domain-containing protein [Ornithinimicrobium pratense]|uniref:Flippase-like domain-containing protein n=1 Tax=Ornithinimicrobium pratense TaxID=2593973 RepID=A0A5J6V5U7_9MICO|nr:lysylphosphatidylglycerol synthase transmembrane domain-containing protein [Ornithinimicrobium pratense]QFG69138.1 flippase-like domain-containing protein [Ornithinimicrobium pratense]